MSEPTFTISVPLPAKLKARLDDLARVRHSSETALAIEAIQAYLELSEWQVRAIEQGLSDADAGRLVHHAEVAKWLQTWGKEEEKGPPTWK